MFACNVPPFQGLLGLLVANPGRCPGLACGRTVGALKTERRAAQDEPFARFDFVADEFGQARVIAFHALEIEQERIVTAPFKFVADLANLSQIAVRVGN